MDAWAPSAVFTVCMWDRLIHKTMCASDWVSEWGMNDRHVLLGMCVCLESVALCLLHVLSATLLLFCLPFLTCFGRFPAIVCMYLFIGDICLLCLFILCFSPSLRFQLPAVSSCFPLGVTHCVCVCVCVANGVWMYWLSCFEGVVVSVVFHRWQIKWTVEGVIEEDAAWMWTLYEICMRASKPYWGVQFKLADVFWFLAAGF